MYIPTRWIDTTEVDKAVEEFIKTLGPEVVRIRYNIGEDWTGVPALYFRVVLADEVSADPTAFSDTARRVESALRERLQPQQRWGLFPHTNFRPKSDDYLNDPKWM